MVNVNFLQNLENLPMKQEIKKVKSKIFNKGSKKANIE
jgi:hypothetical protein